MLHIRLRLGRRKERDGKMQLQLLAICVCTTLFFFGGCVNSKQTDNPDLNSVMDEYLSTGLLPLCPDSPNCVCSEDLEQKSHVAPLTFTGETQKAWQILQDLVAEMGGEIQVVDDSFLHATFRSRVFGFIDDLNCRLDEDNKRIYMRSASRVGYSDFGVNRKRVESVKEHFGESMKKNL